MEKIGMKVISEYTADHGMAFCLIHVDILIAQWSESGCYCRQRIINWQETHLTHSMI
jgi:hypothetical protein